MTGKQMLEHALAKYAAPAVKPAAPAPVERGPTGRVGAATIGTGRPVPTPAQNVQLPPMRQTGPGQMSRQWTSQQRGGLTTHINGQAVPLNAAQQQHLNTVNDISRMMDGSNLVAGDPRQQQAQPTAAQPRLTNADFTRFYSSPEGHIPGMTFRPSPDGSMAFDVSGGVQDVSTVPPTQPGVPAAQEQLSEDRATPDQLPAAPAPAPADPAAPGGPAPIPRQVPDPGQPNAIADVPIPEPTAKPQYRDTPNFTNDKDAINTLADKNAPPELRREAAGFVVASGAANLTPEQRAAAKRLANKEEPGPGDQELFAAARDSFTQEQVDAAVKTNPGLANNPEAFGSFMGQVEDMWNGMEPYGQIAAMMGIPAAVFGMMGGDGISAILGGLGLGALGIGAGAMGYLGEGTQRNMGKMIGQVGNFFGAIPDEARNADLLGAAGQGAARQRVSDAALQAFNSFDGDLTDVTGRINAARTAGQSALQTERTKFEPLLRTHEVNPDLAYSYLMGMDGAAPKTRDEAAAMFARLQQQYDQSGQEGYLDQQLQELVKQRASEAIVNPAAAAGQAFGKMRDSLPAWMPGSTKGAAVASKIWRRHVVKQALSAVDQKELNDLEQWQKTTKVFDEKKVQRLKELQARQAAEFSADKVVKVCMKAARCWAGYEAVPGAKAYSRGSCRPVGSKKTQKEMKNGTERQHEKVKQSGAASRPQIANRTTQRAGAFTAARLGAARY